MLRTRDVIFGTICRIVNLEPAAILEKMVKNLPPWASEMVGISEGDECQPSEMDGVNVVLNRARLAVYMSIFRDDKDIHDLLILDAVANAAGLPLTSTGLAERKAGLCLRPFRIWEYSWLYKTLQLSRGRMSVLDLGGPGSHLTLLAALAGCSVTSIDINADFVRAGRECAAALKLPNLISRVGDMRDLSDFPSESFDIVISCSVLEHLTAADQEAALSESARVLRPGGFVGLTFDYGLSAPGANIYLPPPHDPPGTPTEAVLRYAREGLVVAGNPFCEHPLAGSLFHDDVIRYTVASLFLVKATGIDIRPPRPETGGSTLGRISIDMLPTRLRTRTLALEPLYSAPPPMITPEVARIQELECMAEERLRDLETMHASFSELQKEADARERGLRDLTAVIAVRDERIAELEGVADERLRGLKTMHANFFELQKEADARERGLRDLTAVIAVRDGRIAELEGVADERLRALETMHGNFSELQKEADARERGLRELTAVISERDGRIQKLCHVADTRLTELGSLDASFSALRMQGDARDRELRQSISDRDARIEELGRKIAESTSEREDLSRHIVALENQTLIRYAIRRFRRIWFRVSQSTSAST